MIDCAIVVWRLVPYHDARFSAAGRLKHNIVIEVSGRDGGKVWSNEQVRDFDVVHLSGEDAASLPLAALDATLDRLRPRTVAIQGWADQAAYRTADWALSNNARIVIFSESNRYDHARSGWSERLKAGILSVCDAALVGGEDHADYLVDLGFPREYIAFGYNVVDNAHFAPRPRCNAAAPGACTERSYFLIVSRLVENKNVELAIRAFADYRRQCHEPSWDLVILGAGPLEQHLHELAASLGICESVRLEGFRKYEALPALYQGAGALIQASTWEPWGLAVNEAMAAGLPVMVSTKVGCRRELVQEGVNGFVFEPDNAAGLARHMRRLADGEVDRQQMGAASLRIIADWGPERFGRGLAHAIEYAHAAKVRRPFGGRLLLSALSRARGIASPGALLAERAKAQNRIA